MLVGLKGRHGVSAGERKKPAKLGKGGGGDHAAAAWVTPLTIASMSMDGLATATASLRCASRDAGMPFFRQLWTVETGVVANRATAVVPPRASIT